MAAIQLFSAPQAPLRAGPRRQKGRVLPSATQRIRRNVVLTVATSLMLGGCVVSGPVPDDLVDTGLITGSIAPPAQGDVATAQLDPAAVADQVSDRRIVSNAVSAADIEDTDGRFPWANPQTGTSGVITAMKEIREGSTICRSFQTSRQRFDGIALYNGEACTDGAGQWALVSFAEKGV